MVLWRCVVVVGLSACLRPGDVVCEDGRVCPEGYTCAATTCLLPAQIDACMGRADGDSCSVPNLGAGVCAEGACALARCGNDIVEPGEICDDGNQLGGDGCNGTCTSDESCGNGILELAEQCDCGDSTHPGGAQCAGTVNGDAVCTTECALRRCGDGVLDPGEKCDDNNVVSGDGCSADCLSNETCSNGTIDYFADERCDDGNLLNHDGCGTCLPESVTWTKENLQGTPLLPRTNMALAYDVRRARVVMFGGYDPMTNGRLGDTWEWDGNAWLKHDLAFSPPGRAQHAMAYDGRRGRVVLFGGADGSGPLDDTWEWDGIAWTKAVTPIPPSPRTGHAMAYDSARGRVVLFGGNSDGVQSDTWEWDGATWAKRFPAHSPDGRQHALMAYDPIRGNIALFGGGSGSVFDDTWTWDGADWTKRIPAWPATMPPPRTDAMMAFDAAAKRIIVFGGFDVPTQNDMWGWDGTKWEPITPASSALPRQDSAMAYDIARARLVMVGGDSIDTNYDVTYLDDTIEWNGTTWVKRDPAPSLPPRGDAGVTYDPQRGRVVLFGGRGSSPTLVPPMFGDTWEWNGSSWAQRFPTTNPGARFGMALAYEGNGNVLGFGGFKDMGGGSFPVLVNDTWRWDGTNWALLTPAHSPAASRGRNRMVFDPHRAVVVLYGGGGASNTWEWNGSDWLQMPDNTPTVTPARDSAALQFDARLGKVVLFGGRDSGSTAHHDTWAWDGSSWTQIIDASPPVPSSDYDEIALGYEAARGVLVEFGGRFQNVTWEASDASWTRGSPIESPPPHVLHSLIYASAMKKLLLIGGLDNSSITDPPTPIDGMWRYRAESSIPDEACMYGLDADRDGLVGCADPDCWGYCTPLCAPQDTTCNTSASPRCGDGTCQPIESKRLCPSDCGAVTPVCGDFICDAGETVGSCPGDCLQ